jgi:hypothetical protein
MAERTRGDFLNLLRRSNPRTRKTVMRVIEGKADQDGAAFVQEQLNFIDPEMTVRSVDFISSRTCSFGHLQDQQTRLTGVCERCGAVTCSTPGCSQSCQRCGRAYCRAHISVYSNGEAYCARCRPWALVRWLILGKKR